MLLISFISIHFLCKIFVWLLGKLKEETVIFFPHSTGNTYIMQKCLLLLNIIFFYVETKTLMRNSLLEMFVSVVTSSTHVLLNSYSTVAHNASRPNIQMLTLVPILNCLLFYSSQHLSTYLRASTHPSAFSLHRDHTFSFQMCRGIILNEVPADSIIPYAEPLLSASLTLAYGVDGLCTTIHFRLCLTSMLSETRWRSSLRSQAEVIPNALLTPWQLFAAHLASEFVQRASVTSTVCIALEVIAVNPVIGTGVCAFQKRKIT